jgi:integrase
VLTGERDELMANTAAYGGLRWGELTALTTGQIDQVGRVITVGRKVVEIAGHLYVEAPKNRKMRRTIYPRATPGGYPLAARLADRIEQARAEQQAGTNPLGLIIPSPTGKHWRSSNFNRNVLQRAYLAAGWRDEHGNGAWTWHSLRHVFCTTACWPATRSPSPASAPTWLPQTASAPPWLPDWTRPATRSCPEAYPRPGNAPRSTWGSASGTRSCTRRRWPNCTS